MNVGMNGQWNRMRMAFLMDMAVRHVQNVVLDEVFRRVITEISDVIFVEMNSVDMGMVDFI